MQRALAGVYPALQLFELDAELTELLQRFKPDVVVPVLHGRPGEDGTVQGYLEMLGYSYVGSDVISSATTIHKVLAKQMFQMARLPVAKDMVLYQDDLACMAQTKPLLDDIQKQLGKDIVVKPATQGSALGITRVKTMACQQALETALEYDTTLLLEEDISGREITVGVLEKAAVPESLPALEIVTPENSWYDYEHRYAADGARHLIPAPIPEALTYALQQAALSAHRVLGCRDLSRADFIVTATHDFYLLEVNSMPGMTATSLYPDAARAAGYDLSTLMQIFIDNAWRRGAGAIEAQAALP